LHVLSGGIEVLLQARKMTVGVEIQEKVPAQKKRKKFPFWGGGGSGVTGAPQKKKTTPVRIQFRVMVDRHNIV
jgi:hypothetical protein